MSLPQMSTHDCMITYLGLQKRLNEAADTIRQWLVARLYSIRCENTHKPRNSLALMTTRMMNKRNEKAWQTQTEKRQIQQSE